MRFAVLGDVHGNYYALEAVILDILSNYSNLDGFIFTGDYVGDFPESSKVVDLIRSISSKNKVFIIKGNRESGQVVPYLNALREGKEPNWSTDTTMGAALVSCRGLNKEQLEYLESLPESVVIRNEGKRPIFVKHKMPLTEEEQEMVRRENMVVITAHTHEAHYETKDGIDLFNPGSVGLSDEGIPGATYGILESDDLGSWKYYIRDIDYSYKAAIDSLKEHEDLYEGCCGWGKALELSVSTGINCTSLYAFEAKRLAKLVEEAKLNGNAPDLAALTDLEYVFSQGRYGNVNYDGTNLVDNIIEHKSDIDVFGPTNVITSDGLTPINATPTKELYDIALENTKKVVELATRESIIIGRHAKIN